MAQTATTAAATGGASLSAQDRCGACCGTRGAGSSGCGVPCGVSFTVFNENNFVLYHTNRIAPAEVRQGCPPAEEEVPQARLHQLAFGASFSNVVDAPILSHGAPWLVHIDAIYVSAASVGGGSASAGGGSFGTGPVPQGDVASPSGLGDNAQMRARELKHYRVTITSAYAVNVSPSADTMAVRQYAVALVLTAKTGEALMLLLQFPLVLRHMMNHVVDLGVRLTTDALEKNILGVSMKVTAMEMTSRSEGAALLKMLHASLAAVLTPITGIASGNDGVKGAVVPSVGVPLLSAQALAMLSTEASAYLQRIKLEARNSSNKRSASANPTMLCPPPPSCYALSCRMSLAAFQHDMDRYQHVGDGDDDPTTMAVAASPRSPSRGRRTQQPSNGMRSQNNDAASPGTDRASMPCVDMSAEFSRALRELAQFNESFLSAVVSGILSVSMLKGGDTVPHRHNYNPVVSSIYADFLALARRDSAAVPPQRQRMQRRAAPDASQPASTINDDDEFVCSASLGDDDDDIIETGSPTTSTNTAPPSSRGGSRRQDNGTASSGAAPSVYHKPPHALSYHYSTMHGADSNPSVEKHPVVGEIVPPGDAMHAGPTGGTDASTWAADRIIGPANPHRDVHAQSMPQQQRRGLYASSLAAAASTANYEETNSEFGGTIFCGRGSGPLSQGCGTTEKIPLQGITAAATPHAANRPEARILIFATDLQAARNLMTVAAFFYRHHTSTSAEHTAWVLDAVGRAASTPPSSFGPRSLPSFPAIIGHAASPDAAANLSLLPSLPIVWVPEEWNARIHRDQLSHRLSPETLVLVIAHRASLVERVVLTKSFSTRNITVQWCPNLRVLKEFPYGTCGGCFSMEVARNDTVMPNHFAKRAIERALAAEIKSKGAVSAAMYLEEWVQVLWQQRAVYALLQTTGGRCNVLDAQRVLNAPRDLGRGGSLQPASSMLTVPRQQYASGGARGSVPTQKISGPTHPSATASSRSSEMASKGKTPLGSTDDGRREPRSDTTGGVPVPTMGTVVASSTRWSEHPASNLDNGRVAESHGLAEFNRDLREALQCNDVDATHVQLLHFLSEL